ncbi:uncharacterized protein BDV17DRAFT_255239 [Aspergillus undulatus]|uniref:uncharacterized protein n=1 Tax=Aspergillus undulatus TaxID=1810928 RepID=UPI003CCE1E0E
MAAAAENGHVELVKLFLSKGLHGVMALMRAVEEEHKRIVRVLLEAGTDPDVPDLSRGHAVDEALMCENRHIINMLLHHGASIQPEALAFHRDNGREEMAALAKQFPVFSS